MVIPSQPPRAKGIRRPVQEVFVVTGGHLLPVFPTHPRDDDRGHDGDGKAVEHFLDSKIVGSTNVDFSLQSVEADYRTQCVDAGIANPLAMHAISSLVLLQ